MKPLADFLKQTVRHVYLHVYDILPHLFKVLIVWVNLVPYFSSVSDSFEVFIMKTLPAFDLTKCYLTQCEETHHLKQGNHGYSSNLKRKCRTISCKLLLTYNKKTYNIPWHSYSHHVKQ